jgi:hypothetical protein
MMAKKKERRLILNILTAVGIVGCDGAIATFLVGDRFMGKLAVNARYPKGGFHFYDGAIENKGAFWFQWSHKFPVLLGCVVRFT